MVQEQQRNKQLIEENLSMIFELQNKGNDLVQKQHKIPQHLNPTQQNPDYFKLIKN